MVGGKPLSWFPLSFSLTLAGRAFHHCLRHQKQEGLARVGLSASVCEHNDVRHCIKTLNQAAGAHADPTLPAFTNRSRWENRGHVTCKARYSNTLKDTRMNGRSKPQRRLKVWPVPAVYFVLVFTEFRLRGSDVFGEWREPPEPSLPSIMVFTEEIPMHLSQYAVYSVSVTEWVCNKNGLEPETER